MLIGMTINHVVPMKKGINLTLYKIKPFNILKWS